MADGLGTSNSAGSQQRTETAAPARYGGSVESAGDANGMADTKIASRERPEPRSDWKSYGGELDWLYCRDGKYRPIESGLKPLVDGVPRGMVHSSDPRNTQEARAMRLRGYGNAIVPTLAAEFIKSYREVA